MISTERKPFSKVPKTITTCTSTFSIFVSSSRKEMPEQKLCRKKTWVRQGVQLEDNQLSRCFLGIREQDIPSEMVL